MNYYLNSDTVLTIVLFFFQDYPGIFPGTQFIFSIAGEHNHQLASLVLRCVQYRSMAGWKILLAWAHRLTQLKYGYQDNVLGKKAVCVMLTILPTECQSAIKKKWVASTMYSVHTERILYNWSSVNFESRFKFSNSPWWENKTWPADQPTNHYTST